MIFTIVLRYFSFLTILPQGWESVLETSGNKTTLCDKVSVDVQVLE